MIALAGACLLAGNAQAAGNNAADACVKKTVEHLAKKAFEAMEPSVPDYADASYVIQDEALHNVISKCNVRSGSAYANKDRIIVDRVTLDTVQIRP